MRAPTDEIRESLPRQLRLQGLVDQGGVGLAGAKDKPDEGTESGLHETDLRWRPRGRWPIWLCDYFCSGRDEAFRHSDNFNSIAMRNRRRLIIRDLTHCECPLNGAAKFGRKQSRFYKAPREGCYQPAMRLERATLRRDPSPCQGGSRGVIHRVISSAACAVGIAEIKQHLGAIDANFCLPQEGRVQRRTPSLLMFHINAGFLARSG